MEKKLFNTTVENGVLKINSNIIIYASLAVLKSNLRQRT